jgi:hypothetical protein
MQRHKDSHLDHSLTAEQVAFLLKVFADRTAFFIETIELPEHLGTVPCGLYGPIMGDAPIEDRWVEQRRRPPREYTSRVLARHEYPGGFPGPQAAVRQVRQVTVIAGPHDGLPCVLYTAYGGPCAPQEPNDPGCRDRAASEAFWSQHALVAS